jgi:hypothetical protein
VRTWTVRHTPMKGSAVLATPDGAEDERVAGLVDEA